MADDYDDTDTAPDVNVLGPDGPRVCREMCTTCIFRPGNLMRLRPGRVKGMVRDALAGGGLIPRHSTYPSVTGEPLGAICRGFFDKFGLKSNLIRIWGRLGGFVEVDPPASAYHQPAEEARHEAR
jgi:hypothetical protein